MTVLGKETFGCVVSPYLKCTDSTIKTNRKVSKIMREKDVENKCFEEISAKTKQ